MRFSTLKYDIPSGLVVFLIALPLCLGIALASGAPLFSGIITGIIGGLVVSLASGSQLSVSGPAAGLTLVVSTAIENLGFTDFLTAIVLAGVLQLIFGFIRAGAIALYFPSSVIKGMLAAIGVILILKQIPHAFGYDKDYLDDFSILLADGKNTWAEIKTLFTHLSPGILVVAAVSFMILLFWDKWLHRRLPLVPVQLIVVIVGIMLVLLFNTSLPYFSIGEQHMVQVPVARNFADFLNLFTGPDFTALYNPKVWTTAIVLGLVASLETLLSIEAIDKLDPEKRVTPTNRELKAQGLGNIICGLIGGLPMTAVIVRGSANVASGARSKFSSFFHGLFMLIFVLSIPSVLNQIPFACLAAILIVIGFKLTKPSLYREMYRAGTDQFIPFITTVIAIVALGLLYGICVGLATGILYILLRNMKNSLSFHQEKLVEGEPIHIVLSEEVSFLNKAHVMLTLDQLPHNSHVIIDGSKSKYIDYDVLEIIHNFRLSAAARNMTVELIGIKPIYTVVNH